MRTMKATIFSFRSHTLTERSLCPQCWIFAITQHLQMKKKGNLAWWFNTRIKEVDNIQAERIAYLQNFTYQTLEKLKIYLNLKAERKCAGKSKTDFSVYESMILHEYQHINYQSIYKKKYDNSIGKNGRQFSTCFIRHVAFHIVKQKWHGVRALIRKFYNQSETDIFS